MSNFTKAALRQLSSGAMYELAKDAEYRIGSHIAGGDPTEEYIKQQRNLLDEIQEELKRRNEEND